MAAGTAGELAIAPAISSPNRVPRTGRDRAEEVAGHQLGEETLGEATPISGPAWV